MLNIPLDKTWLPNNPILVVDFRVALFAILRSPEGDDYYLHWQRYLNSLPNRLGLGNTPLIVVDDQKDKNGWYWRQKFIDDVNGPLPDYKGNRKAKPTAYKDLLDTGRQFIRNNHIDYFVRPGIEADDWAGLIYTIKEANPDLNREIILCTVDKDWYQLVSNKLGIKVFDTGNWRQNSRLKDELEVLRDFGYPLGSPRDIVDYKMIYGDIGDNLIPGSPREVIDLTSTPPAEYCKFSSQEKDRLLEALINPMFYANSEAALVATIQLNNNKVF